jgi:L-alanine-DL-glutamate epimerase-like enolase superfamily enzyme
MRIEEIEIREFTYRLENVGTHTGYHVYEQGSVSTPHGFVMTIRDDTGEAGHYRGFHFTPTMIDQVQMVAAEFLIGRDPREREGIWQDIWHSLRHTDHFGVGPIDIALWDLAGRHNGESVSTMLGGYRDRIPAYASTFAADGEPDGLSSPEQYAAFAEECREEGYPAFKIHPSGDPSRDIEICRAVASRVGDEMEIMLDPASMYQTYGETLRVGRVLDELGFFWYEDPMADAGESEYMSRRLADDLDTPILGAEHSRTGPQGRANHIMNDALDFVRADAHLGGGITGVMKVAHLAEAFGIDVELHLGGPAHLHCLSAIRNTNYFEHGLVHPQIEWVNPQGLDERVDELNADGTISVPEGPGLGVEIDWEFVEDRQTNCISITEAGGESWM